MDASQDAAADRRRGDSTPADDLARSAKPAADKYEQVNRAAAALAAGVDHEANFRFLYQSFYRPLQRFFSRQGFAAEECFDLTQETFVGILRGLKAYRHQDRFQGWLYQLAKTTYLKRRRAAATAKRSAYEISHDDDQEALAAAMAMPAEQLDTVLDGERRQIMRDAVGELPKQMRQCMTLHLYQGLSYTEIATVMKVKLNTVKAHMFQGRQKLLLNLSEFALTELKSEVTE